jgi:hypothetical protein
MNIGDRVKIESHARKFFGIDGDPIAEVVDVRVRSDGRIFVQVKLPNDKFSSFYQRELIAQEGTA